jgi:hypothetical protein
MRRRCWRHAHPAAIVSVACKIALTYFEGIAFQKNCCQVIPVLMQLGRSQFCISRAPSTNFLQAELPTIDELNPKRAM